MKVKFLEQQMASKGAGLPRSNTYTKPSTKERNQSKDTEKQVMTAHQITFNQHIVMDNRQEDSRLSATLTLKPN